MKHALMLALVACALSSGAAAGEVRFVKYEGKFAYGLRVAPPWKDGGHLDINLPEHLESMPGTQGVLRWNDKAPKGTWTVSKDGKSAKLNVKSPSMPGVFVKGEGKVVGADRIEITMTIDNTRGKRKLGAIRPLYCFHYKNLAGFPRWVGNFKHSHIKTGGKLMAIADAPRKKMDGVVVFAAVVGCSQQDRSSFAEKYGGIIENGVGAALSSVESMDGKRRIVFGWTPGKSMLSNAGIPCIHADPYYGDIAPGESKTAKCVLVFTEKPLKEAFDALEKEGVGAPEKKK